MLRDWLAWKMFEHDSLLYHTHTNEIYVFPYVNWWNCMWANGMIWIIYKLCIYHAYGICLFPFLFLTWTLKTLTKVSIKWHNGTDAKINGEIRMYMQWRNSNNTKTEKGKQEIHLKNCPYNMTAPTNCFKTTTATFQGPTFAGLLLGIGLYDGGSRFTKQTVDP